MVEREGQILKADQCETGDFVTVLPQRHVVEPFTAKIKSISHLRQIGNAVVRLAISPWMRKNQPNIPSAIGGGTDVLVVKQTRRTNWRERRNRETTE